MNANGFQQNNFQSNMRSNNQNDLNLSLQTAIKNSIEALTELQRVSNISAALQEKQNQQSIQNLTQFTEPLIATGTKSNVENMTLTPRQEAGNMSQFSPNHQSIFDRSSNYRKAATFLRNQTKRIRSQDAVEQSHEGAPKKDKNLQLVNQYRKMKHLSPKTQDKNQSAQAKRQSVVVNESKKSLATRATDPKSRSTKTQSFLQKANANNSSKTGIMNNMYFPIQQKISLKQQQLIQTSLKTHIQQLAHKPLVKEFLPKEDSIDSIKSSNSMTGLKQIEPRKYKKHDCCKPNESVSSSGSCQPIQKFCPRTTRRRCDSHSSTDSLQFRNSKINFAPQKPTKTQEKQNNTLQGLKSSNRLSNNRVPSGSRSRATRVLQLQKTIQDQLSTTSPQFNHEPLSNIGETEYRTETADSFVTSDFRNHIPAIKQVQQDWEGQPQTDEFWKEQQVQSRESHPRDVMSSISMKSGAQQVLEQQQQIFTRLKSRAQTQVSNRQHQPDDQVILGDEALSPSFREHNQTQIRSSIPKMPNLRGDAEPIKPHMGSPRNSNVVSSHIKERDSADEQEDENTSHLHITSYDDWFNQQKASDVHYLSDDAAQAHSAITKPNTAIYPQMSSIYKQGSQPHTAQAARTYTSKVPIQDIKSPLSQNLQQLKQESAQQSPLRKQKTVVIKSKKSPPRDLKVQLPPLSPRSPRVNENSSVPREPIEALDESLNTIRSQEKVFPSSKIKSHVSSELTESQIRSILQPKNTVRVPKSQGKLQDHLSSSQVRSDLPLNIKKKSTETVSLEPTKIVIKNKQKAIRQLTQHQPTRRQADSDFAVVQQLSNRETNTETQSRPTHQISSLEPKLPKSLRTVKSLSKEKSKSLTSSNSPRSSQKYYEQDTISFYNKRVFQDGLYQSKRDKVQAPKKSKTSKPVSKNKSMLDSRVIGQIQQSEEESHSSSQDSRTRNMPKKLFSLGSASVEFSGRQSYPFQPQEECRLVEPQSNDLPYDDFEYQSNNYLELIPIEFGCSLELKPVFVEVQQEIDKDQDTPPASESAISQSISSRVQESVHQEDVINPIQQVEVPQKLVEDNAITFHTLTPVQQPNCPSLPPNQLKNAHLEMKKEIELDLNFCERTTNKSISFLIHSNIASEYTLQTQNNQRPQTEYICQGALHLASQTTLQTQFHLNSEQLNSEHKESQVTLQTRHQLNSNNVQGSQHLVSNGELASSSSLEKLQSQHTSNTLNQQEENQKEPPTTQVQPIVRLPLNYSADIDSDEDAFIKQPSLKPNMCDAGIQTSNTFSLKLEEDAGFQNEQKEKDYSTDWQLSSLYNDLEFKKAPTQSYYPQQEDCGQQVSKREIEQEQKQILSQIECEYNAEMLKKKQNKVTEQQGERRFELYILGLNTLQALMFVLRLQKEWDTQVRKQYELDLDMNQKVKKLDKQVTAEQVIKLLTRCKKMYECKSMVLRLLRMSIDRDRLVKDIQRGIILPSQQKDSLAKVKRMNIRVESQIAALQEEHRIFKRPFILGGKEYLSNIKYELFELERQFCHGHFIDEKGTVGNNYDFD